MTTPSEFAWHNGALVERECAAPSVASISFHLGTGVFDGIMAYWNDDHYYLHCAEEHLVRFRRGASTMGMSFDWTTDDLLDGIMGVLESGSPGTQYIRPIAFRGAPELWVTGSEGRPVDVAIFTVRTDEHRDIDRPLSCMMSPIERVSSRAFPSQTKVSGSYVNSFQARRHAELKGFQDGIMLDRNGLIAEASAANVFFVEGDRLHTPLLSPDIFPGITRRVVLDTATELGVDLCEAPMTPSDLHRMDGAFLCSTLMEIRAISRLDSRELRTQETEVFNAVLKAFRKLTSK